MLFVSNQYTLDLLSIQIEKYETKQPWGISQDYLSPISDKVNFNYPLKILLFPNRTGFHHLNNRSVRYSNPYQPMPKLQIMKIPDVACTASCIEKINLIKFENKKFYRWRQTTAKDGEGFAKKILFFLQASQLTIFHLLNHASIPRNIIRFEMKLDKFTTCFKICGTSPLF